MTRLRRTAAVVAGSALVVVAAGCQYHTELAAECVTYRTAQDLTGTIVTDIDAPLEVRPGQTFTITVNDVSVRGVSGTAEDPQYPNGVLSVTGPVSPAGDIAVGEDVLAGGTPLPNALTYTAAGSPGDTISIRVQQAQSFYGDFLFGDRYTCDGQGRQLAAIQVVGPDA
jgi:hypothetical protein